MIALTVTPVPQSIQIAHEHAVLLAEADFRDGPCNLSRNECPAPSWGFMVEQDTTIYRQRGPIALLTDHPLGSEDSVCLAETHLSFTINSLI